MILLMRPSSCGHPIDSVPMPLSNDRVVTSPAASLVREKQLLAAECLDRSIWVPQQLSQVFPFFAEAKNLEQLTPDWLRFEILSDLPIEMQRGTLIDYRIRLYGIPMRWRTLISSWEPPFRFVDEQILGPYSQWWHEHTFEERDGGTLLRDHVRYRAPLGVLSHPLMVRRQLRRIFDYRTEVIQRLFGH